MSGRKIHFVASQSEAAVEAMQQMSARYGQATTEEAEVIVALGGDGFMLRTLHRLLQADLPVYGMKFGNVGFLMNRFSPDELEQRLDAAKTVELNPLSMVAQTEGGGESRALAINEAAVPAVNSLDAERVADRPAERGEGRALVLIRRQLGHGRSKRRV